MAAGWSCSRGTISTPRREAGGAAFAFPISIGSSVKLPGHHVEARFSNCASNGAAGLSWIRGNLIAGASRLRTLIWNGQTYDHIRSLMPECRIYVFDRRIAAH